MSGLDVANGMALRAHHHRVGFRATLEEPDPPQEVAGGHPGRREDDVPLGYLLHLEDLLHVLDAHLLRALDLLLVPRGEPPLHVAAHASDGRRGDHALGSAADAHQHVDARLRKTGGDGRAHVAVADQLDARPVPRTSAMSFSWRGRLRMITVRSST